MLHSFNSHTSLFNARHSSLYSTLSLSLQVSASVDPTTEMESLFSHALLGRFLRFTAEQRYLHTSVTEIALISWSS